MHAWTNLVKKEIRLGQPAFWIAIGLFLFVGAIAGFFGNRSGYLSETLLAFSAVSLVAMVLYLAYYLIFSFGSDTKRLHIWMHQPASGKSLISAKLASGLLNQIVTIAVILLVLTISVSFTPEVLMGRNWADWWSAVGFIGIHVVLLSISISMWLVFFWMIFLFIKRSMPTILSIFLTIVLGIITLTLIGWFADTQVYSFLTQWGAFQITDVLFWLDHGNTGSFQSGGFSMDAAPTNENGMFYAGNYVYETIVTILLFVFSCWILDRKVEV
ncbi:hypothetical protein [Alteribacillus sp. HJP-4]|uniref:hypothetical protein n=1 Tax=Alteribacillus sp. HJP-4 TaxID=2775394 RepID=UPI0035CCF921